jgi:hypothetical protein
LPSGAKLDRLAVTFMRDASDVDRVSEDRVEVAAAERTRTRIRRDDDYIEALAAEGIIEHGDGKYMTCYRRIA